MAIVYALLCLVFAALNDLLFKFFARKPRSRGIFVAIIGIVWLAVVAVGVKTDEVVWGPTLCWGLISGMFSVTGNLLLIEAMGRLGAGLCSTVYRLNLVPVAIGAALLLDEKLARHQWFGVGFAVLAVLAFWPRSRLPHPAGGHRPLRVAFAMIILAALLRAGMGLSYRYGFLHEADRATVTAINALCWIGVGLAYAGFREKHDGAPLNLRMIGYGILSGVLVGGISITMSMSLKYGEAAVVLPIAQMSFLLTALLSIRLLKEKFTPRFGAALLFGITAIILLVV